MPYGSAYEPHSYSAEYNQWMGCSQIYIVQGCKAV